MKNAFGFALIALAAGLFAAGCPTDSDLYWTVHYEDSGGGFIYPSVRVLDGSTLKDLPTVPARAGLVSAGWHTDKDTDSRFDNTTTPIKSHITLYAKWQTPSSLTTWTAAAEGNPTTTAILFTFSAEVSGLNASEISIAPAPGSPANAAKGTLIEISPTQWRLAVTATVAGPARVSINSYGIAQTSIDVSIRVQTSGEIPDPTYHTVTFEPRGGLTATGSIMIEDGQPIGSLPTATRHGYDFGGWWTHASEGEQIDETRTITGEVTFYARWTARPPGEVWHAIEPGQSGFPSGTASTALGIKAVAYGGNKTFVAVGEAGRMARSIDGGETWAEIPGGAGSGSILNGIASNGEGIFVAVGTGGRVVRSDDGGENWSAVSGPVGGRTLEGIAYGNEMFIAVGQQGRMMRSGSDGGSWTAINAGLSGNATSSATTSQFLEGEQIRGIAFGDGTFIAVGDNGRMARSTNGSDWFQITSAQSGFANNHINVPIRNIAFGNGTFIAVGFDGRMARSSNGNGTGNWTRITGTTFGTRQAINDIAYGAGWFIAVADHGSMARSDDNGASWTAVAARNPANEATVGAGSTFTERQAINGIAFGDGRFVAVGGYGRMSINYVE
ncbi:MAG: InlB B-repeat-containing protein [Treponema sp.]|nr:InlB B-repeat-containing protein [Treponema sp.]